MMNLKNVIANLNVQIPFRVPDDENTIKFISDKIKYKYMINKFKIIGLQYTKDESDMIDLEALEMLR